MVIGSASAGYKFDFKAEGVFLTIYPTSEKLFELSDMRQILRENKVNDYDVGILSRTIREASGRAQKISEAVEGSFSKEEEAAEENFAQIIVELTRDKMQATIRYDTRGGAKLPTTEMILTALNDAGVVFGIDHEAIEAGSQSLTPFVAAKGTPPINGENAYIDRKFNLGISGKPHLDEFGRADYKDLNLFVLAKENQTLAIRIPQTKGTSGKNVLGQSVPPQNGRPCPMPEGKNTKVVGEHRLIATCNGQIVDTGNRISIDPRLEIKGSVGVETGDIEFDGSVTVKGNVEFGFNLSATGDIEIKGSVNGAQVRGRNVYISGGITGTDRAKVFAQNDIRTAFAENATLEADNNIFISDIALHSQIRAGKSIFAGQDSSGKGQIIGGHAIAGELVSAKSLGNSAFVVTKISVGIDPNLQRQYLELKKSYKSSRRQLTHITQTLNTLSKIDINKLPPARIESINALTRSQFPLAGQIRRTEKSLLEIEEKLSQMKNGRLHISDTIYPGVRLAINSTLKSIQSEYKHCTISLNDAGEVDVGPY